MSLHGEFDAAAREMVGADLMGESVTYHPKLGGAFPFPANIERFERAYEDEGGNLRASAIVRIPHDTAYTYGISGFVDGDTMTLPLRHRDDTPTRHRVRRIVESTRMFLALEVVE